MSEESFRAVTACWSAGGNTRKVAEAIHQTLTGLGLACDLMDIADDPPLDVERYHLLFVGAPVYAYLPPEPVIKWLKGVQGEYDVLPASPERPGRYAVPFCTYGGPHTGVREAVPMLKYVGQIFEHVGVPTIDEWAVVGEFHLKERQPMNTAGRLGDIRGRPNEADLREVCGKVIGLLRRLRNRLPLGDDLPI